MSLTTDDLRAAIAAGAITEMQAARIVQLAEARQEGRQNLGGLDEPFELFHGFNEVFIVLGLCVLFAGWTGIATIVFTEGFAPMVSVALGMFGMLVVGLMARYFTLKRRMNGPSSALAMLFAFCAAQAGLGIGLGMTEGGEFLLSAIAALVATLGMIGYFLAFRVPFSLFLVCACLLIAIFCFIAQSGNVIRHPRDAFLLSASGAYAYATFLLGLGALTVAMWFDMSDPHRVTRRATNGFWLHIVAAPAIVNTISLTLFVQGTVLALLALALFLIALAAFAMVIDRRSFLIAGAGYVAALAYAVTEEAFFIVTFVLGSGLVLLGAQWEVLRGRLMAALPDFAGKDKLPPWGPGKDIEAHA